MIMRMFAVAVLGLALSACEMAETESNGAVPGGSSQVMEEARFNELAVGQPLYFGQDYLTLTPDGEVTGQFGGQPLQGTWEWRDGAFCRTLVTDQGPSADCQTVVVVEEGLQFTRERGSGNSFVYTRVPTPEPV